MKKTELKEMAILEMKRAIETAYYALDEKLCDMDASEQDRDYALRYMVKIEDAFNKRYDK